jgi:hypothetical protein
MQIHHDSQTSLTPNPDELVMTRAVDFLGVSTFLKPNFRIAVAPSSGELRVQVELKADAKSRRWSGSTRH